jgi:hypothetical protein
MKTTKRIVLLLEKEYDGCSIIDIEDDGCR